MRLRQRLAPAAWLRWQYRNGVASSAPALSTTVVPSGAMPARFDAEHFQFSDCAASDPRAVAYDKL